MLFGKFTCLFFLGSDYNNKSDPSHDREGSMGLHGMPNLAANSRFIDDIELDSDGEGTCFNMAISSSSEDEDAQDGDEVDYQTSEAQKAKRIFRRKYWRILGSFLEKIKSWN